MACEINNIQDPTLKRLVSTYGEEGLKTYLNIIAPIVSRFEVAQNIDKQSAINAISALKSYNVQTNEYHYYEVNGVPANVIDVSNSADASFNLKLKIDFGEKYTSQQYQYNTNTPTDSENIEDINKNDDDPEMDPSEHDVEVINDDDILDIDPLDSVEYYGDEDPEVVDTIGEEYTMSDDSFDDIDLNDTEDAYINEHILDDDFDLSEVADYSDLPFSDNPLEVNTRLGIKLLEKRLKNRESNINQLVYKLQQRIADVEHEITLTGSSPENLDKLARLTRQIDMHKKNVDILNTKRRTLARSRTIKNLDALYEKNAQWINAVLKSKNPGAEELLAVSKAIEMWQNLRNNFATSMKLDTKTLNGILDIQKKALNKDFDKLHSEILPSFIKKVGADMYGLILPSSSLTRESDIGVVGANTLSLGHYSDKPIINFLHKLITSASSRSSNELFDVTNRIKTIFHSLKEAGLNYKDIFSYDKDGKWDGNILSRYTKAYYNFINKINEDFIDNMNDIKYNSKPNSEALMLKEIKKKSEAIKQNIYTINPQLLSNTKGLEKLRSDLLEITKDDTYTNQLIEEATSKWNAWSELYEHMQEREKELISEGRDVGESKEFLSEFKKNTSPVEYFNYTYNNGASASDIRMFNDIEKYSVKVPLRFGKNGNDLLSYDQRFNDKVLSSNKMLEFYNAHAEELRRSMSYLPGYATKTLDGTFVPNVRKKLMNTLLKQGLRGIPTVMKERLMSAITSRNGMQLEFLDEDGNPKNAIPIMYTKNIEAENKSEDLEDNLIEFATMAVTHKHLAAIEDYALIVKSMLEDKSFGEVILKADGTVDVANTNKNKKGEDKLKNLRKLVAHTLDNVLYNKSADKEGVLAKKIYDPNRKIISVIDPKHAITLLHEFNGLVAKVGVEKAINKTIKNHPSLITIETEKVAAEKMLKIIDDLDWDYQNGKITKEDFEFKMSVYKQFTDSLGLNVIMSEVANLAITFGAYKTFSYNPFPAVTNIAFGQVCFMSHAAGRTDFTPQEAISASIRAARSLKNTANSKNAPTNKHYNLAMRYGILPEHYGGDAGAPKYNLGALNPMAGLSTTDYILRVQTMDAMMHHETIEDASGKKIMLWEAFNNDGSWNSKEFGENNDWGANPGSLSGNKEILTFMNKVKFVNQLLHGNMAKETAILLKKSALGRLVSQYRMSWLADGVYARFAPRKSLGVLGRDFEGTYITMKNFISREGIISGTGQLGKIFAKLMMFKGESSFDGVKIKPQDRALFIGNIRKQLFEMKVMLTLAASWMLLSASMDDDDKETKKWKYMMLNNMNNTIKDITFFADPQSFKTTTDNLIPAIGLFDDYRKLMTTVTRHMMGNPYYDDEKVKERIIRTIPAANVYYKYLDRTTGIPQTK